MFAKFDEIPSMILQDIKETNATDTRSLDNETVYPPTNTVSLSGNTFRVSYHLCIRHTLGTVFELHQSSENTHRYFHFIKNKNTYRLSYAA